MDDEKKIEAIDRKLDSVLVLLRGNELDKQDTGLVGTMNDIDDRVKRLERWKDRIIVIAISLSVPAGLGIKETFIAIKHLLQ